MRRSIALLLGGMFCLTIGMAVRGQSAWERQVAAGKRERALIEAAKQDNLAKVKELVQSGVDVNTPEGSCCYMTNFSEVLRWTPFEWAAYRGDVPMLKFLLGAGADPGLKGLEDIDAHWILPSASGAWSVMDWTDSTRTTPDRARQSDGDVYVGSALCAAALSGRLEAVRFLVESAGLSPGEREKSFEGSDYGWTALMYAAMNGDARVVSYLLQQGSRPGETEKDYGYRALHFAAVMGRTEAVEVLLRDGADPNARDDAGETPLHLAAGKGSAAACRALLAGGAGIEVRDDNGWTPLHMAGANGRAAVCDALLEAHARVNAKDRWGRTPLHLAAGRGNGEACLALLAHGADPRMRDGAGLTPLHFAAASGDVNTVLLMCQAGARIRARDVLGYTPLHYAAWLDHEKAAALLLLRGAKPDAAGKDGMTPLHLAALEDSERTIPLLLNFHADPNKPDADGWTPLHLAAGVLRQGWDRFIALLKPDVAAARKKAWAKRPVHRLLEFGADVDARNDAGETPLHVAAGALSSVGMMPGDAYFQAEVLLAAKADVNALDNEGRTPLDVAYGAYNGDLAELLRKAGGMTGTTVDPRELKARLSQAVYEGDEDLVRTLLDQGADPSAAGAWGDSVLMRAIDDRQKDIARMLIERGADVNAQTRDGRTALYEAALFSDSDIMEALLHANADANVARKDGETPLSAACTGGMGEPSVREKCVALLLGAGAKVDARDRLGRTALHAAAFDGSESAAGLLLADGASIDARDDSGLTPLGAAELAGKDKMAAYLRARGASAAGSREARLYKAVEADDIGQARDMLERGANALVRDRNGNSLAFQAAHNGDRAMLELLADHGLDMGEKNGLGVPPLAAVPVGDTELVEWLLDHGAAEKGEDGAAPSLLDVPGGLDEQTARLYLDHGFTVDPPPGKGSALIARAVYPTQVSLLLKLGADPNARTARGWTALHSAANGFEGTFSQKSVDLLIAAGADVNAQDDNGDTPAHKAVRHGRKTMLAALARAGADFSLPNKEGLTPLGLAKRLHNIRLVAWLERYELLQNLAR